MAAGILTPTQASTSSEPTPAQRPVPQAPQALPPQPTTTSINNPLANVANVQQNVPPVHTNEAINTALMQAFHPAVPDAVNGLMGPVISQLMGQNPLTYYQPRPAGQVATRRSS